MANEIGHWNAGTGAETESLGGGDTGNKYAVIAGGLYTAGASERITMVRMGRQSGGGAGTMRIGLFATAAGVPTGTPIYTTDIASTGAGQWDSDPLTWDLTNGVTYALAAGYASFAINFYANPVTDGGSRDETSSTFASAWTASSLRPRSIILSGDVEVVGGSPAYPWSIDAQIIRRIGA